MLFSEIFSEFSSPPKKIHNFFPPVDLRIIFFELRLQESHFSHRFGRFLPFWGGHLDGVATTRLMVKPQGSVACALPMKRWRSWRPTDGLYLGPGRGWEVWGSDAPQNHGRGKFFHCCCEICSAGRSCSY